MDRKNDNTEQEEFPGYPAYAPEDDIIQRSERIEGNLDDELLTHPSKGDREVNPAASRDNSIAPEVESDLQNETPFDVTAEDLEALGPEDLSLDMSDDEQLKHRQVPVDFAGKDLDVPGSELDDRSQEIGSEDEENDIYSVGGDNHEDLEERRD